MAREESFFIVALEYAEGIHHSPTHTCKRNKQYGIRGIMTELTKN